MIELLKKAGAKISKEQELLIAIMEGEKESVTKLIQDDANINYATPGLRTDNTTAHGAKAWLYGYRQDAYI